jgi:L-aminopeptidase/D-esterase-like protein
MRRVGRFNAITDVRGLSVGHFTDLDLLSGITVVLADDEAVGGVDVRGGAPGTRETDLLSPTNLIESVDGIALCGNSVFGLNAVGGVVRFLEERGRGHRTGNGHVVPIVPAAVLFDLGRGVKAGHLSEASGYGACESSSSGNIAEGNVGAGTGAVAGGLGWDRNRERDPGRRIHGRSAGGSQFCGESDRPRDWGILRTTPRARR